MRAAQKQYPIIFFFVCYFTLIFTASNMIRFWERPYFELTLSEPFYDFSTISSSIWYVMISITTVGYGNMVATTPFGRISVICTVLVGGFLMGLLVGILLDLMQLSDREENAVSTIQSKYLALKSIKAALQYNVQLQRRIRSLRGELRLDDEGKHICDRLELNEYKITMVAWVDKFSEWRKE